MDEKRHPGITMHKLSVGEGFEGLLFTVGTALIFLFGIPALWYFVAFSAAFGIIVAVVLRLIAKNRTERSKPLSILATRDTTAASPAPTRDGQLRSLSLQPTPEVA